MALAVALGLVEQVDLDVADVRTLAQVVLAHEAVEVDRRGGADVDLVVDDLGDGLEIRCHFVEYPSRVFDGRAFGHIEDDLELRLVVERQHFHDDEVYGGKTQREQDRDDDAATQPAAR